MLRTKLVFASVANGDRHYSPARIAGSGAKQIPSLKATNNPPAPMLLAFSERFVLSTYPAILAGL